jgi:hypothetical protein
MPSLIGNKPNQVPTNGDLGTLAFQDASNPSVGNLTFTGTGNRILGDWNNTTIANRVAFQTSNTNQGTLLSVIPNGTSQTAGLTFETDSAVTTGATLQTVVIGGSDARVASGIRGAGTYLPLTMYTGGSERLRIDTSGNVGIGATPNTGTFNRELTLSSGAGQFCGFTIQNTTTGTSGGFAAYINNNLALLYNRSNDGLVLGTNNTERMRIDNAGNVGIGTSSPTATLDVNGNLAITGSSRRITGDFSNTTLANRVAFQTSTTNGATTVAVFPNGTGVTSQLQVYNNSDPTNAARATLFVSSADARIDSGASGTGTFLPLAIWTGGSEKLRIDTSGNVGIGTTSLSAEFTVNNETDTTAYNGTATDGQLTAGATQLIRAAAGANTNVAQLVFQARAAQPFNRIVSSGGTAPFMAFATNNAERMRIASDGVVTMATGSGLSISATAVTSPAATDGNVFSGTYTPTLTNTTNIAASTAAVCQYMRVGSVVTVSGTVAIDPTAAGQIVLGMSLPIASALTAATQCGGTFAGSGVTTVNIGSIVADATNDRATFDGVVADTANRTYAFTFTYRIL